MDLETCKGAATIGLELADLEPSAALGVAALLEDRDRFAGRHVVTVVCGGNVDPDAYRRWVARSSSTPSNASTASRIWPGASRSEPPCAAHASSAANAAGASRSSAR